MKKIIVIGTTGSGKTTLAKALAEKLNYPYIQLDLLFWKPNWESSSDEEFFERIEKEIDKPNWVLDGNYGRTNHITWKDVDTVVWINLPFWLTLYQNVSRSIKRAITSEELWPNTGNRESFKRMLSKDSIVLWLFKTYDTGIERYEGRINGSAYSHINFHRLRSRRDVTSFIESI